MIFTPVPKKILKKMGYLKDQEGIINRYLREYTNWEDHLQKTNNFIIEAMQKHRGDKVVVLGSGWLLDFPVKEALELCSSVELVDIYHPKQILHKYKGYDRINFVEADITGGLIESVYSAVKNHQPVTDVFSDIHCKNNDPLFPGYSTRENLFPGFAFPASSLVISLNILNQLDILIVDYIKKQIKLNKATEVSIREYIQSTHIDLLKNYNHCLITDYEEKIINSRDGSVTSVNTVYATLPEGSVNDQWEWMFDTKHFYHKNALTVFQVKAVYQSCV